ncbi:MAG: ATP-dependent helicase [Rhodothermales bacterium]
MNALNPEQDHAANTCGNVVVTACPGSGKTRVLTARVLRGLLEQSSTRNRVVALTFTNRAADEIQGRIDQEHIDATNLWAGTIHAFALEWILRPYAPHCEVTRFGFSVADEFYTRDLLSELKSQVGLPYHEKVKTSYNRRGPKTADDERHREVFDRYKAQLREEKLIDFHDVLFYAYSILEGEPEIARTLSSIIRLICVDEVQDIQDLPYAILSSIYKSTDSPLDLFFVGDPDQSIYESLGALTKSPEEICAEFELDAIKRRELVGCYRSTQRIIDFYRGFRPAVPEIESRASDATSAGTITFQNRTVDKEKLPVTVAGLIASSIDAGVSPSEICVLAPQRWHIRSLANALVGRLPHVDFDAPGVSPIHGSRDNIWFKVGRLFLTSPTPERARIRIRWANELLTELVAVARVSVPESCNTARRLLRSINQIDSEALDGLEYLRHVFEQFLIEIEVDLSKSSELQSASKMFFENASRRIDKYEMPADVESLRKLFRYPSGVVINTCHGVKGEEFDTVIAFGLLKGYVPNWDSIFKEGNEVASDRASKLLYVICSRAKRRLHLIAESGRRSKTNNPYTTTPLLNRVEFEYDVVGI